jgi:hypothetical protein
MGKKINLYQKAYLYQGNTVVLDKGMIAYAKDEDYRIITLLISGDEVREFSDRLRRIALNQEEEDEDSFWSDEDE